jgi:dihydrofolate reductase
MRKIIADLFISLDGVVEAPETWTGPYFSEDVGQMIGTEMAQSDTMLLGRVTYETFAASFAGQSGGMADQMNAVPKIVVSRSLGTAEWNNTTLISDITELADIKTRDGRTIALSGSAGLVRSLLAAGLLDELRLLTFPVVVGHGQRLFDGTTGRLAFELAHAESFSGGAVRAVYRPIAASSTQPPGTSHV